ncbi:SAP domain protein [Pseudocercospora fijiensis CIRAD86]|uniref:SAP domain protein n=1 Tax=Pseudocercospora fijiensis (strain CIRAD86) TaxID=383855 RepID=M3B5U0_PSEFD|nr:SAP domain protein [Pseudocercospora fijiensis CIRAD86]EME84708.1 SAP domain protein [Pseudocercospora fijiensis CIRAD86]
MTDYDKLKVADLKDLVKERGITSTGLKLKQQFIDALQAEDAQGESGEGAQAAETERVEVETAAEEEADAELPAETAGENGSGNNATAAEQQSGNAEDERSGSDAEVSNKRKRRSATPPLSDETVSKKLKTADEQPVKLPEHVAAEAPVPMDQDTEAERKVLPYGSSDDVVEMKEPEADSAMTEAVGAAGATQSRPRPDATEDEDVEMDTSSPPSRHPVTRALYLNNLVRPLKPEHLREHLLAVSSSEDSAIEIFHLDKLRTHAFVLFGSKSAATRVRAALHDKVWPDEPQRKALWVDYIPNEKVQEWIDTEVNREARNVRWEVVYEDSDSGVITSLQDVASPGGKPSNAGGPPSMRPPARHGDGMPNAPSGPRRYSSQSLQPPTPQRERAAQSKSFDSLDANYKFTESKPKIYYQPVAQELVESRLQELAQGTSRDWDDRQADPSLYAEGELRRYTFEDGDRLVDGGADFGLFGRRPARGGFRGRGRGDRGGIRGDHYRGGGARR